VIGVLGGLEIVEALNDADEATTRPLEVVAWVTKRASGSNRTCSAAASSVTFSTSTTRTNARTRTEDVR